MPALGRGVSLERRRDCLGKVVLGGCVGLQANRALHQVHGRSGAPRAGEEHEGSGQQGSLAAEGHEGHSRSAAQCGG
eukprot:scaffold442_cov268-Pinguiococcus_pyrenoidosus.AAC.75